MKKYNFLVVKETKAGEKRVALVPNDALQLIKLGHNVFVEYDAGIGVGFSNQDYQNVGCIIRKSDYSDTSSTDVTFQVYKELFNDIDIIIRAKRPDHAREVVENKVIAPNTTMIGALDPLERNSTHIEEYHKANIIAYSIDQMELDVNDPMNLLSRMSKIAGLLALQDAVNKFKGKVNKVVILGFGIVGKAAFAEAVAQKLPITVIAGKNIGDIANQTNVTQVILDRASDLLTQQQLIREQLINANIVITSARQSNQVAPILIPTTTLNAMQKGSVVVDMAISEGGNVENSVHDETLTLGNGVIVTNTSGYPKMVPLEASIIWSNVTLSFILKLINKQPLALLPC